MENTPAPSAPDASNPVSEKMTRHQHTTEYVIAFLRIWEAIKVEPKSVRELEALTGYSYYRIYHILRRFENRRPSLIWRTVTKTPITHRNVYLFQANEKAL
jgi:hypothetical protein